MGFATRALQPHFSQEDIADHLSPESLDNQRQNLAKLARSSVHHRVLDAFGKKIALKAIDELCKHIQLFGEGSSFLDCDCCSRWNGITRGPESRPVMMIQTKPTEGSNGLKAKSQNDDSLLHC